MNGVNQFEILSRLYDNGRTGTMKGIMSLFPHMRSMNTFRHFWDCIFALEEQGLLVRVDKGENTPLTMTQKAIDMVERARDTTATEDEERTLSIRKLRADVVVAEWMQKTYWWTFVLSILGFLLGSIATWLSIKQLYKL